MKNFQIIAMLLLPAYFILPTGESHFTICPIFHLTGNPCPGCGMGRSLVHIFHFHFIEALYFNPFGFVVAVIQCYLIISFFFPGILNFYSQHERQITLIQYLLVLLFISFGAIRFYAFYTRDSSLLEYFFDFHKTFSLLRWILS